MVILPFASTSASPAIYALAVLNWRPTPIAKEVPYFAWPVTWVAPDMFFAGLLPPLATDVTETFGRLEAVEVKVIVPPALTSARSASLSPAPMRASVLLRSISTVTLPANCEERLVSAGLSIFTNFQNPAARGPVTTLIEAALPSSRKSPVEFVPVPALAALPLAFPGMINNLFNSTAALAVLAVTLMLPATVASPSKNAFVLPFSTRTVTAIPKAPSAPVVERPIVRLRSSVSD